MIGVSGSLGTTLSFSEVRYHKAWYGTNRNFEVKIIFRSVMREAGRFKKMKIQNTVLNWIIEIRIRHLL